MSNNKIQAPWPQRDENLPDKPVKISPKARYALKAAITSGEIHELMEEYNGICFACGNWQGECEPDARNYECEECGQKAVFGAEEAMFHLVG